MLLNLLDNAVKYGPREQRIVVAARGVDGFVRLSVSDQGPGVAEVDRARIWRPFVRAAGARDVPGGGIGPAIVRDLMRRHRGRFGVGDAPGGGATFFVEFPTNPA